MLEGRDGVFDNQKGDYQMLCRKPAPGTRYDLGTFFRVYRANNGGNRADALMRDDFLTFRMRDDRELDTVCSEVQAKVQVSRDPDNLEIVPYEGKIVAVVHKILQHTAMCSTIDFKDNLYLQRHKLV